MKSCPLAHYELVTLVTSPDVEQPKVKDTTLKLQNVIAATRPNLSDAESQEFNELLTEYGDIFRMMSNNYGRTNRVHHLIDMGETRPIHQPPRTLPLAKQAEVGEMLNDMQ
jgi:hypothetical protein